MRTILEIKGSTKNHREEMNKIVLGEWKAEDGKELWKKSYLKLILQ